MEIVIEAPRLILWVALGAGVVVVASVLLKKGRLGARIAALAVTAGVLGALVFFLYRPLVLQVTDEALVDKTYFKTITVPWSEISRAFVVRDLGSTPWRPTFKTNGNALPDLKSGWFRLENGRTARVLIQSSRDALILETPDVLFVLAPDALEGLLAAVATHVEVEQ